MEILLNEITKNLKGISVFDNGEMLKFDRYHFDFDVKSGEFKMFGSIVNEIPPNTIQEIYSESVDDKVIIKLMIENESKILNKKLNE